MYLIGVKDMEITNPIDVRTKTGMKALASIYDIAYKYRGICVTPWYEEMKEKLTKFHSHGRITKDECDFLVSECDRLIKECQ